MLDDLQAAPIDKLPIDEEWITVPAAVGDARVRIVRPAGSSGTLPVIVYMHGGGWILGNAATHDRLVRELAVGARAALLFVEYPNSPEARYPVAIEQGYATAQWVVREGATKGLDASRMAVAGESVGGNMAAALTLMAKERGDVTFVQTSMYYPVTDAAMDTASYDEFAEGYYLTRKAMEWFWDAYIPDPDQRGEITASPNQATTEQLTGLPPTLLFVDEADVLRDEGEAYAAKLRMRRRSGHHGALRRRRARLHAAQRDERGPRHARRHRPGHRVPQGRARHRAPELRSLVRATIRRPTMSTDARRTGSRAMTSLARSNAPSSNTPRPRSQAARSCRCSPRSRPASSRDGISIPARRSATSSPGPCEMEIEDKPTLTLTQAIRS